MHGLKTDVVIIGAGVIGSSIAYHLAGRGLQVTLVEKGELAAGSSGACDGLVFLQSKKPGIHLELAMQSRRRFDDLVKKLPVPIEYKATGGMVIVETQAEKAAMEQYVATQQDIGLDVRLLDADRARRLEPLLSDRIWGAAHSPLDGQVNPIALTLGFALGAKALGARVMTHSVVRAIEMRGGSIAAVVTDRNRIETDVVVNAAGAHASEIGGMVGVDIPIEPRRGQIIVTQACPPAISHCMISAKYIVAKYHPDIAKDSGEGISIEQTENGNFLLGSTREFAGFDKRTTITGLHRIARQTTGLLPMLAQVNVIRAFAGLRPYTPDGLPILGPVDAVPGFIMAAGHEGDGIALSPITGELVAQLIATGRADFPLQAFHLNRFASHADDKVAANE